MAGRAVIWTGLGTLPWIWALVFGWLRRKDWPNWKQCLLFLTVWLVPGLLFHATIHIGDPDHALTTIPALCLLGGLCLCAAEQAIFTGRGAPFPKQFAAVWMFLLCSLGILWLLGSLPARTAVVGAAKERGLAQIDAQVLDQAKDFFGM